MSSVLYIKANAKPGGTSRTFQISDRFVEEYRKFHPEDKIITLDIAAVFGPKTDESKNHKVLKYAYQFAGADKYIMAEPMWNLGVPAILKAYIDYVCVKDIAFHYTEHGAEGLLAGKKAVNIVSRGGDYCSEPACFYELGDRYLKTIFAFFGITDFTTIFADKLDIVGEDPNAIVNEATRQALEKAKSF